MQSTRTCSFPGCDNPHKARGLCDGHYKQNRKGWTLRPLLSQVTLEQRFWAKVQKSENCWAWTALTNSDGYGHIWVDGRYRRAHRVAWEMTNGPIPEGMDLDHRCGNRACVNPDHLRVTTRSQNGQHRTGSQCNNTSGVRGVTWRKDKNTWRARATLNGRLYHGGYYPTLEAADKAARALRAQLFTHDDHAEWLKKQEKAS